MTASKQDFHARLCARGAWSMCCYQFVCRHMFAHPLKRCFRTVYAFLQLAYCVLQLQESVNRVEGLYNQCGPIEKSCLWPCFWTTGPCHVGT